MHDIHTGPNPAKVQAMQKAVDTINQLSRELNADWDRVILSYPDDSRQWTPAQNAINRAYARAAEYPFSDY